MANQGKHVDRWSEAQAGIDDPSFRTRTGTALKRAYATLDQVLKASADGMRIIDSHHRVIRVSDTMTALSGVPRNEAEGHHCYESFSGPHCMTRDCPITRILRGETHVEYAVDKKRRDGITVPCLLTATPFHNEEGQLIGIIEELKDISELVRTEKALRQSEEKFRSLVENAPNVIFIAARDGTIEFINRIVPGIDASVEEAVGMNVVDFMDSAYRKLARTKIDQVFATGRPQRYESSITTKGRAPLWFETLAGPIDFGGEIVGATLTTIDITRRRAAETALRSSEARHRALLEAIPDLMFRISKDGVFLELIPSKDLQPALTPSQFLNRHVADVMPPDVARKTMWSIGEVLATRGTRKFEYQLRRPFPDGEARDYEVRLVVSGIEEVLAIVRDITRRKRAEEALRASEERFRLTFESAQDGIIWADPHTGRIINCNRAAEELLEIQRSDIVGRLQHEFFLPSESDKSLRMFNGTLEAGQRLDEEARLNTASGTMIPVHLTASVTPVCGTHIVQAIFRDISARTLAYEALRVSEERHRSLFDDSPIPLREEDLSMVKRRLEALKNQGVASFSDYFRGNPARIAACASMIKLVDANRATVKFYGAKDKDELRRCYTSMVGSESYEALVGELVAIAEGVTSFECEARARTMSGEHREIVQRWHVAPGCEDTFSKVIVSVVDLTRRKRAEQALRGHLAQLLAAQKIQEQLLPKKSPVLPGFEMAGSLRAAELAAGDYFDYIPLLDGTVAVTIGDVSGHGFGPALLMASTRAHLRSIAQANSDVGEILSRVNTVLASETEPHRFVTLLLARLDPTNRSLVYVNAGHPAGFVLDRSGAIKATLEGTTLPLAVLPEIECRSSAPILLDPGDLILLLTDGVPEACSGQGEDFTTERALEVVRASQGKRAQKIVEDLTSAVCEFCADKTPTDDVTVVAIKVLTQESGIREIENNAACSV